MSPENQVTLAHQYLTGKSWTEKQSPLNRVKINSENLLRIVEKSKKKINHSDNKLIF